MYLSSFLHEMEIQEAQVHNKLASIYGNKTPKNVQFLPIIKKLYPNAKYILLIREPKDVIASYIQNDSYNSLEALIEKCKYFGRAHQWLLKNQQSVLLVKYEDLVRAPKMTIEQILSFIELPKQENILDEFAVNATLLGVEKVKMHDKLKAPINAKGVGNYKSVLSQEQIKYIDRKLQKLRSSYHYDVSIDKEEEQR